MAANINRVVVTGNLTEDPEPATHSRPAHRLRSPHRRQRPAQGRRVRSVGRQAQLLQRQGLGSAGRERRPVPRQGPPRRDRRTPRLARMADKKVKRQAVDIIADTVQFLGGRDDGEGGGRFSQHNRFR